MHRKPLLIIAVATAATAIFAPLGSAATTARPTDVTDLNMRIDSAKLIVEGLAPQGVEVSGNDPALQGKPVAVSGTISRAGALSVAPTGFIFPELPIPENKLNVTGVSVDILLSKQATGTVSSTSGEVRMPLSLAISLKAPSLGLKCLIRGFDLAFVTGKVAVGSGTSAPQLSGSVWDKASGGLKLVGSGAIPDAAKIPASDCDVVSRLVASQLSGKALGLSIAGTATLGTSYKAPPVASITTTKLAFSNKRTSVSVSCAGTSAANRPCSGELTLTANTSAPFNLTGRYSASPGRSATVTFALTDAQRNAIRSHRVNGRLTPPAGRLALTVDNGTGTTRSLSSITSN